MRKPVLYLPFDETTADYSGNENDGTVSGATYVTGKNGKALSFDGIDDYVDCGDDSSLDFNIDNFTIAFWLNTALDSGKWVIGKMKDDLTVGYGVYLSSGQTVEINLRDGVNDFSLESTVHINDEEWHLVVITRIYSGVVKIYIDGILDISDDELGVSLSNIGHFYIGKVGNSGFFSGIFDDVHLYNKDLSAEEVLALYDEGASRYGVVVDGVPMNNFLLSDGFAVHPNVTEAMSWAELFFKNRSYERGDTVLIYLDHELVFDGVIKRERVDTSKWTAIAYDRLYRWRDEPCIDDGYYKYENQLAGTILVDLLNHYFPDDFDTANVDAGGTLTAIYGHGQYVYDLAQEIARRANFDLWLDPPNKVYFKDKESVASGETTVYGVNILNITAEWDDLEKRDKIIVYGRLATLPGFGVSATSGTGDAKHFHMDESILTDAEAQEVADALLAEKNVTLVTGEVQLKKYKPEIRPGKTVVLHATRFGFNNAAVRVTSAVHTPSGTSFIVGDVWSPVRKTSKLEDSVVRMLEYALGIDYSKTTGDFLVNWYLTKPIFVDTFKKFDEDVWYVTKDASAATPSVVNDQGMPTLKMATGSGAEQYVQINSKVATWGTINCVSVARLRVDDATNVRFWFGGDDGAGEDYIRAYYNNGTMKVLWRKNAGTMNEEVIDISAVDVTEYNNYKIERSPSQFEVYINEELKKTVTTDVTEDNLGLYLFVSNTAAAQRQLLGRVVVAQEN